MIQFHPGTIGWTPIGFAFPAAIAGHPKHAARPTQPVRVGVTKSRTKFVGDHVPSRHPADDAPQNGHGTNACDVAGYTDGRQHGLSQHDACLPVRAENIGLPSLT